MNSKYPSRKILELSRLPIIEYIPDFVYDSESNIIERQFTKGFFPFVAKEIAKLTLQKESSLYNGNPNAPCYPITEGVVYVAGINLQENFLIVGQGIDFKNKIITLPAKLSLQDLISYKTLQIC